MPAKYQPLYNQSDEHESLTSSLLKNPLEDAGGFSRLFFFWMTPLFMRGLKHPLEMEDIWDLRRKEKAEYLVNRFDYEWDAHKHKKYPLLRVLNKIFGCRFWYAAVPKFLSDALSVGAPLLMKVVLDNLQNDNQPSWIAYVTALCMFLCQFASLLVGYQFWYHVSLVNVGVRSVLSASIYRKAMKLSNKSKQEKTTGEIVNLMTLDCQKVAEMAMYAHLEWSALLQIGAILGALYYLLGWSAVIGFGVMLLVFPVTGLMIQLWSNLRVKSLKVADSRIKLITEILQGIRIIKFFNWEDSFIKKILDVRKKEVWYLGIMAILKSVLLSLILVSSIIVCLSAFACYTWMGYQLKASLVFTAIAYFGMLRYPLMYTATVANNITEGLVSINRLQQFFNLEEREYMEPGSDIEVPIKLKDCNFEWNQQVNPNAIKIPSYLGEEDDTEKVGCLSDISIQVKKGELVCIVGSVGSGKSSLIQAIIGEMPKVSGKVSITGEIAYCPQTPWIQNATVRDNITFGLPYDPEKYDHTLTVCSLKEDLKVLDHGDMTEIGEKGITLSGGQRQRVSIARAVYQDKDIYLFDDPLSALDAHVGKYIFEKCILGHLKDKTRILVTHQLDCIKYASNIIVIEHGKIVEMGTYNQLLEKKDGHLQKLIKEHTAKESKHDEQLDDFTEVKDPIQERKRALSIVKGITEGTLMQVEERFQGAVSWKVLWSYFKHGGGVFVFLLIIFFYWFNQVSYVSSDIWISLWVQHTFKALNEWRYPWGYLFVYSGIGLVTSVISLIRCLIVFAFGLVASNSIHNKSFKRVIRAPMAYFDTTPLGRFLSRFSKDQDVLDTSIIQVIDQVLTCLFSLLAVCAVVMYATLWFILPLIPVTILYIIIQHMYRSSSREIKRLESMTRGPMFSHFAESLNGISTIRAYGKQQMFIEANQNKVNTNMRCWFAQLNASLWLGVRVGTVSALLVLSAIIFAIINKGSISASTAGLSFTYILQLSIFSEWLVSQLVEAETQLTAVERLTEYMNVEIEKTEEFSISKEPRSNWPSEGEIVFKDFKMKYRPNLPLVLNGVSFHIKPGEKIGIVGRTGAGKTSIMYALYRMVEGESGSITIDEIDIRRVNLSTLRKRLSIIPQEPILFTGTVRSNIDPFHKFDDRHLWRVLEKAHLRNTIDKLPGKLDSIVAEGGENFSAGERQLICLARALCIQPRILILDECTSSVDVRTDALIQQTIDQEFKNCTRLTIAHRLNTIINSDRILVMDKGVVAEFDTPKNLLLKGGIFFNLVNETGAASSKLLKSIAMSAKSED